MKKSTKISCARRGNAILKALAKWQLGHPHLYLGAFKECPESWNPTYAIIQMDFDDGGASADGGFFDWDACRNSYQQAIIDAAGPEFKVFYNFAKGTEADRRYQKLPDGTLVLMIHGNIHGEIELYRKGQVQ